MRVDPSCRSSASRQRHDMNRSQLVGHSATKTPKGSPPSPLSTASPLASISAIAPDLSVRKGTPDDELHLVGPTMQEESPIGPG
jgi:hypothetical protein